MQGAQASKATSRETLRSIRWSNIRVSGEPVHLPILPPIKRFQIKVIESVHNTWGILRWDGAMCEAPNISNAVARRAEAPQDFRREHIPMHGTVYTEIMQYQELMGSFAPS